jgi:hypothetical protein
MCQGATPVRTLACAFDKLLAGSNKGKCFLA